MFTLIVFWLLHTESSFDVEFFKYWLQFVPLVCGFVQTTLPCTFKLYNLLLVAASINEPCLVLFCVACELNELAHAAQQAEPSTVPCSLL